MFGKLSGIMIYGFFERAIAFALSLGMVGVILIASGHLAMSLYDVAGKGFAEFDYQQFQRIFEQILTVLIALEFNHSLTQVVTGVQGFIQVRTIVLIAILAAVRKFIVLDVENTDALFLVGLAVAIFAMGAVYVMLAWIDYKTKTSEGDEITAPGAHNGNGKKPA